MVEKGRITLVVENVGALRSGLQCERIELSKIKLKLNTISHVITCGFCLKSLSDVNGITAENTTFSKKQLLLLQHFFNIPNLVNILLLFAILRYTCLHVLSATYLVAIKTLVPHYPCQTRQLNHPHVCLAENDDTALLYT